MCGSQQQRKCILIGVIASIVTIGYLFFESQQIVRLFSTYIYDGNRTLTRLIDADNCFAKKKDNPYLRGYVGNKKNTRRVAFNTSLINAECFSADGNKVKDNFDKIDFRIIVITYDRNESLTRLLNSLNKVQYGSDKVQLEVWIDRKDNGFVHKDVVNTATMFKFLHGRQRTCVHRTHVGIVGQWISTWSPAHDSQEIVVILEDDLTVSPYLYQYLKSVHKKYPDCKHNISGFALQGESIAHASTAGREFMNIPDKYHVFLYSTLGTWGFSPKAKHWREFKAWFAKMYNELQFMPYIPDHKSSNWFKMFQRSGTENGIWEMWHICYSWYNHHYTLYPTFPGSRALTYNWKENGLHYNNVAVKNKDADKDTLVQQWSSEYDKLPDTPIMVDNFGHYNESQTNT